MFIEEEKKKYHKLIVTNKFIKYIYIVIFVA